MQVSFNNYESEQKGGIVIKALRINARYTSETLTASGVSFLIPLSAEVMFIQTYKSYTGTEALNLFQHKWWSHNLLKHSYLIIHEINEQRNP